MTRTKRLFNFANVRSLALAVVLLGALGACSDDDDEPNPDGPVILSFEYGEGSEHSTEPMAYKGSDIHMEAEIDAPATVSSISVEIHAHDLTLAEGEEEWEFEQTYTGDKYLVKNPTFHEHVDIPTSIPSGKYNIIITVTDKLGNRVESEGQIDILDAITLDNISIDESVVRGSDLHAEFRVNAVHGVHHVVVDIHAHGLSVGEGETEWHYEGEFEEGYHGETEIEFHEHIDVPSTAPAGEYHIVITVEDEEGNTSKIDSHLEVSAS